MRPTTQHTTTQRPAIQCPQAPHCQRCGDPMMQETVIKLRRSFGGFRETRFQRAWCVTCGVAVPIETSRAPRSTRTQPIAVMGRARICIRGVLPGWLRSDASRSAGRSEGQYT